MNRICPNCDKNLTDREYFFCLNCGHKLEDDLIRVQDIFKTKVHEFVTGSHKKSKIPSWLKFKKKKKKKRKKKKIKVRMPGLRRQLLIGFSSVVVIALLALGVIYLTKTKPRLEITQKQESRVENNQQTQEEIEPENPNVVDLGLSQESINLANDNIIKYIPYDTDFYIIGSDVLDSARKYFGEIKEDGVLEYAEPYAEGRFVLMGKREGGEWILTTIVYLEDKKVEDVTFEEVDVEDLFVEKVDDVLVVTNQEEMIENVTDSSTGLARNIAQNPKTRMDRTEVPKDGQIIFVSINEEINELEELTKLYVPTEETADLITPLIEKNPKKFVIKNKDE